MYEQKGKYNDDNDEDGNGDRDDDVNDDDEYGNDDNGVITIIIIMMMMMKQLASNHLISIRMITDAMNKKIKDIRDNGYDDYHQRWKQPLEPQPQPQKSKTSDYWDNDATTVDPWEEWDRISDGFKKRKRVDTMPPPPPSSSPPRKSNNSPPEERLWRDRNKKR